MPRILELRAAKQGRRYMGVCALSMAFVGACNLTLWLPPLAAPEGTSVVPGGIVDTRPMFGKSIGVDGAELGDFLLATCGCGDWRILIQDADGGQQQCAVRYFTAGEYSAEGEITFQGNENGLAVLGVVDQTTGAANGELDVELLRRRFTAQRRDAHTDDIEACVLCHIGNDPIYPQPDSHPAYVEGVTNCLECHDVVIE